MVSELLWLIITIKKYDPQVSGLVPNIKLNLVNDIKEACTRIIKYEKKVKIHVCQICKYCFSINSLLTDRMRENNFFDNIMNTNFTPTFEENIYIPCNSIGNKVIKMVRIKMNSYLDLHIWRG